MIRIEFRECAGGIQGFSVTGHAGFGSAGNDIVCAAVSSAAYMTANTITEILGEPAAITVDEGLMMLTVTGDVARCRDILSGFRLHLQALQDQYPTGVHLTITEV